MCFLVCSEIHASSKLLINILDFPWAAIEEDLDFSRAPIEEERSVEIINPSEKLDSMQLDSSEQLVCVGFDVTKSG